jgi:hypothetical protein
MLNRWSEKDCMEFERIIDAITKALPEIRAGLLGSVKRLPGDPGGRPRLFDQEQQASICRAIGLADGVSLQVAQERIGLREDASSRTIKRIWARRKKRQGESSK